MASRIDGCNRYKEAGEQLISCFLWFDPGRNIYEITLKLGLFYAQKILMNTKQK